MTTQKRIPDLPVSTENIRALSRLNPARSLGAVFTEWLIIAVAVALHLYYQNPWVYVVTWILIGSRMYALYSLLHDGMHFLLYPHRQVNDWLSKLLLAWPLFLSLEKLRNTHMAHHKHLRTGEDPEAIHLQYSEFQFPKTKGELAIIFLKDLTGINFIYYKAKKIITVLTRTGGNKQAVKLNPGIMLYYLIIFTAVFYMGWETKFLLYWLLPYATIYQALNRLRLSTEHFHIPEEKLFQTRTVKLNFIERFIFSPHNLGFHAEHHLYPGVPFYQLPSLHKLLMSTSQFKNNVMISTSYFAVIKKYTK